jgi:hypothetical protein
MRLLPKLLHTIRSDAIVECLYIGRATPERTLQLYCYQGIKANLFYSNDHDPIKLIDPRPSQARDGDGPIEVFRWHDEWAAAEAKGIIESNMPWKFLRDE